MRLKGNWNELFFHTIIYLKTNSSIGHLFQCYFMSLRLIIFLNIFYFHSLHAYKCLMPECRQKSRTMYNTQVIMTHWCWMKSETEKPNSLFIPFVFEFWKWKRTSETDENGYWAILRFWFYEPYSRIAYLAHFSFSLFWFSIWMLCAECGVRIIKCIF